MVNIVGTEAGFLDFFHGKVACKLVYNGGYHFHVCQFVGTERLSMVFLLDFGVDIQGESDLISALKVIFVIFKVVNSFKQLLQHGVPGRCVPVPVIG